jgi:DNA/RNA endonuclease G (NUC1)
MPWIGSTEEEARQSESEANYWSVIVPQAGPTNRGSWLAVED